MKNIEFKDGKIINLLKNAKLVKKGEYGCLLEYDKNTIFKFYSSDLLNTYLYPSVDNLHNEVEMMKDIDRFLIENDYTDKSKIEVINEKMDRLSETSSRGFITSIVTYNNYPVGILTNTLSGYVKLNKIYAHLSEKDKYEVLQKIKSMLVNLEAHSIFYDGFNENNIMLRAKDKKIVFLNLDDNLTRYEDIGYIKNISYIHKDVNLKREEMIKRLNR